ncbi:MAG: protein kinase, partial [Pseudomonadota bacterium]
MWTSCAEVSINSSIVKCCDHRNCQCPVCVHLLENTQSATEGLDDLARNQAEAHYSRYRILLTLRQWDEALLALQAATQLDPGRFAPFPLEDYEPQRILGVGGFGVTFLCRHKPLGHDRVIKTLHPAKPAWDLTGILEARRLLQPLCHPAIIAVSDVGGAGSSKPYLIMDYCDATSLETLLAQGGPLTLDQTLALAQPLAQTLQAAHEQGVLHGHLTPGKVLVRHEPNGTWTIRLIGFGELAHHQRLAAEHSGHALTRMSLN